MFVFSWIARVRVVFFTILVSSLLPGAQAAAPQGLLALYDFSETSGATVHDVSGVGSPMDLRIADTSRTRWLPGGGLQVNQSTRIASVGAATKISDAIKASNAVTIEAWIQPASTTLKGPARIVTLSKDPWSRNFTLGQQGAAYDARLRSTSTNGNGTPSLSSPSGSLTKSLTHVVYTRDAEGRARLYVNGTRRASIFVGGKLSSWDSAFRFALANELAGDRPWLGSFYRVAVYKRALGGSEIAETFAAGSKSAPTPVSSAAPQGLLALYDFSEASGATVHDVSGVGSPVDLRIADTSRTRWLPGGGLQVNQSTRIASVGAATKISDAIKASNAVTIEAWIQPASTTLKGPARIVTLSKDPWSRNFTLGQQGAAYDARLRSTSTNSNGTPSLSSPSGSLTKSLTHVVYTRDAEGRARLYVNGTRRASIFVGGKLSSWDSAFRFALANELTGDRPWLGSFYRVAVYKRALGGSEIAETFAAGSKGAPAPVNSTATVDGDSTTRTATDSGSTTASGETSSSQVQVSGTVSLSWKAPTTRTNGQPLSLADLAGYTVYYGGAPANYSNAIRINDPYTTSVRVTDLPGGTYYFAVKARDAAGQQSSFSSSTVRRVVD